MSTTLLVMCRLWCAGASGGGLGSLRGLRRFSGLGRLGRLGGLVGRGTGNTERSASRRASRSASRNLQCRATAATTLHGRRVQKGQEARAVGDIIVGAGPVRVTLVE